jgi:hypothetical protein
MYDKQAASADGNEAGIEESDPPFSCVGWLKFAHETFLVVCRKFLFPDPPFRVNLAFAWLNRLRATLND